MNFGVACLVMAAAAAKEHQRHQPATDDKREQGAKADGYPAVLRHRNVTIRPSHIGRPDNGHEKDRGQHSE
jgi:hypothetical protein